MYSVQQFIYNRQTKLLYFQLVPKLGRGSPKPSLWNDTKDAYLLFVNSTRVYIHNVAMSIMPAIDTMFLIIVVKDLTWINTKKIKQSLNLNLFSMPI